MSKGMELDELSDFLKNRAANIESCIETAIKQCGEKIRSDIQYDMAHTPRNMERTYYTNNKTKGHHPSMPENPPAPDTGNLRESIRYEVHKEGGEVYGIVGSTQKDPNYAVYTEYGTSSGGWGGKGMAPRPWLRPAMRKNNDFIRSTISKAVKRTLEGAAK